MTKVMSIGRGKLTISGVKSGLECLRRYTGAASGQDHVPTLVTTTKKEKMRAKSTNSETSTKTRPSQPETRRVHRKQELEMQNETHHACRYSDATIYARGRGASATVVSEQASIRAKWARRHEKVEFFSKRDEENDHSQSEKQRGTSERIKIWLGSCAVA
jgi:hypothetical protein